MKRQLRETQDYASQGCASPYDIRLHSGVRLGDATRADLMEEIRYLDQRIDRDRFKSATASYVLAERRKNSRKRPTK